MISKLKQTILLAWLVVAAAAAHGQDTNMSTNAITNATTTAPAATDFRSFDLIIKRNIFDPTRSGSRPSRVVARVPKIDSFTLVGTMSYEQGQYAFFDGNRFRVSQDAGSRRRELPVTRSRRLRRTTFCWRQRATRRLICRWEAGCGREGRRTRGLSAKRDGSGIRSDTPSPESGGGNGDVQPDPGCQHAGTPAMSGAESDAIKRLMLKRLSEK